MNSTIIRSILSIAVLGITYGMTSVLGARLMHHGLEKIEQKSARKRLPKP